MINIFQRMQGSMHMHIISLINEGSRYSVKQFLLVCDYKPRDKAPKRGNNILFQRYIWEL